jgi:hypothetical protein
LAEVPREEMEMVREAFEMVKERVTWDAAV